MAPTTVLEGLLTPEQEKTYVHLPFDVPENVARLDVTFEYSDRIGSDPRLTGGNTIDLGVFGEAGVDFLHAGFRGWSGSERDRFFITPSEATPGYLAGPIGAGRWHLLLGLYKIAPHGCRYRAEITVTAGEGAQVVLERRPACGDLPSSPPPAPYAPWLRGELHCHTHHSDGVYSPAELVALARERGMDFLAVSDHNTTAAQRELETLENPGLVLIRGVESTTFRGHFNVWGIPDWVDFRVETPEQMRSAVAFANDRGAVTSCGHPKPLGPNWEYEDVNNPHCVEVWNGPWNGLNEISLAYWVRQIDAGRQVAAVGGSDYHRPGEQAGGMERQIGTPTNWVPVEGDPSPQAILAAIRAGRACVSDTPDGPLLDLRAGDGLPARAGDVLTRPPGGELPVRVRVLRGAGCRLILFDQSGECWSALLETEDESVSARIPTGQSLYLRAELRTPEGWMRALTNPVYLQGAE